jgi:hypothetical protein
MFIEHVCKVFRVNKNKPAVHFKEFCRTTHRPFIIKLLCILRLR